METPDPDSYYSSQFDGRSTLTDCTHLEQPRVYVLQLSVLTIVFGVFGFISNVLFLITVAKQAKLRNNHLRMMIVTLSIIDTLISSCYILIGLRWLIDSMNYIIALHENLVLLFRFPFQVISCVLIILITTERYQAIRNPMKYVISTTTMKTRVSYAVSLIICLFSLCLTCVIFIILFIVHPTWQNEKGCDDSVISIHLKDLPVEFTIVVQVINYILVTSEVLTVIITISLSVLVYRMLANLPNVGDESQRLHVREQRNLTIMVIVNTGVFCTCVVLQDILTCIYLQLPDHGWIKTYILIIILLTLLNSCLNPIIYNIFGSIYRQAFLETFPCVRRITNRSSCRDSHVETVAHSQGDQSRETSLDMSKL